jgi:hypothetical protein
MMNDIITGLEIWRKDRNMEVKEFEYNLLLGNLLEELGEYFRATTDYDRIDALCDVSVFCINTCHFDTSDFLPTDELYTENVEDILSLLLDLKKYDDVIIDIVNVCYSIVEKMGYDYHKCMIETIKEISSREQDPSQKLQWYQTGVNGKWQKNKLQAKSTLYSANYESCKR